MAEQPALERFGHRLERPTRAAGRKSRRKLPRKSFEPCLDALHFPGHHLERERALVRELGIGERVVFAGHVPHARMAEYYCAADALVLASDREGWANVLLESMACGTPVVATNIWGTPEVVAAPEAGLLVQDRSPVAIAAALRRLLSAPPAREAPPPPRPNAPPQHQSGRRTPTPPPLAPPPSHW